MKYQLIIIMYIYTVTHADAAFSKSWKMKYFVSIIMAVLVLLS